MPNKCKIYYQVGHIVDLRALQVRLYELIRLKTTKHATEGNSHISKPIFGRKWDSTDCCV